MTPIGLTSEYASAYQKAHGYNEIIERKQSFLHKLAKRIISPISLMLLVAALLSFMSGRDFDAYFILFLLLLNIGITLWQEYKADTAIQKLNEHLRTAVKVLRDGQWQTINARFLVPDDIVELKTGDIVPADAAILEANNVSANEAALTGESLPKEKKIGSDLYSGSFLASGFSTVRITAIGNLTSFGKTLSAIDSRPKQSALEVEILRISRFLILLSGVAIAVLTLVLVLHDTSWIDILRLDLSLVIAGIPISLPTVMTLIIAFGVIALAKKNVIVRRLSALEELANTNLLLTDKTGTLTKNIIIVTEVRVYDGWSSDEVRRLGARIASEDPDALINQALLVPGGVEHSATIAYTPADSSRKRGTLVIREGNHVRTLSLGAPQVIESLCEIPSEIRSRFEADIARFAEHGYRALALAVVEGETESHMALAGIFALSDELRGDTKPVIQFLGENGIGVVMLTGDNRAIAKEVADKLGIPGNRVIARDELIAQGWDSITEQTFRETQAFAEILPEDKYELVNRAKRFYTVASNGDGVNDLPAMKAASIGFAVSNAVDALKGTADFVLLSDGIGVMRDAFLEGRKIFARLYSYSLYRISESFRLIVTIVLLGLLTGAYPLSPLQLILIALLNDIPIISLAFDRVKVANRPSKIQVRKQFTQSVLYGTVGVVNSMLLYFFIIEYLHLPLAVFQTLFFLKLTVSGHLLIYVAHTKERWYRYLPSKEVIIATSLTQGIATALALTGFLMSAAISWQLALFIWIWSFFFMQISELVKQTRASSLPVSVVSSST